jgi:hypothetical protein
MQAVAFEAKHGRGAFLLMRRLLKEAEVVRAL